MNDMVDMSRFIEAKSDQLNADDLIGRTLDITITRVTGDGGDQPVSIYFEGDGGKPWKPCKTMRRVLMAIWGKYASKDYPGRSCRLYRDDSVTFGGLATGGIRISHASHIDKEMLVVVMKTKGKKAGIKVLPMPAQGTAKPDRVLEGVKALLARIEAGEDIDEDQGANTQRKWLESNRPDLFKQIEDALSARGGSPFEGPSDEQRGESHAIDADWIIGKIAKLARVSDVNALVESHKDTILAFDEEDRIHIAEAQDARNAEIRGAE